MDSPSLSPEKKRKSVANLDNQLTLDIRSKALTIDYCSSLFATICHCSPLFETIRIIRDYSLFAIRYSGFPDTLLIGLLLLKNKILI